MRALVLVLLLLVPLAAADPPVDPVRPREIVMGQVADHECSGFVVPLSMACFPVPLGSQHAALRVDSEVRRAQPVMYHRAFDARGAPTNYPQPQCEDTVIHFLDTTVLVIVELHEDRAAWNCANGGAGMVVKGQLWLLPWT